MPVGRCVSCHELRAVLTMAAAHTPESAGNPAGPHPATCHDQACEPDADTTPPPLTGQQVRRRWMNAELDAARRAARRDHWQLVAEVMESLERGARLRHPATNPEG